MSSFTAPPTRLYLSGAPADWRNDAVFSFDLAMAARGVAMTGRGLGRPQRRTLARLCGWLDRISSGAGIMRSHETVDGSTLSRPLVDTARTPSPEGGGRRASNWPNAPKSLSDMANRTSVHWASVLLTYDWPCNRAARAVLRARRHADRRHGRWRSARPGGVCIRAVDGVAIAGRHTAGDRRRRRCALRRAGPGSSDRSAASGPRVPRGRGLGRSARRARPCADGVRSRRRWRAVRERIRSSPTRGVRCSPTRRCISTSRRQAIRRPPPRSPTWCDRRGRERCCHPRSTSSNRPDTPVSSSTPAD